MTEERWLDWAKRLRAIAQTGKTYTQDPYDAERYDELRAIAEQMLAGLSGAAPDVIRNLYVAETGYPTPKLDVRGGVFRDGEILLVRETTDGRWSLPGGWIDEHDSPARAAEREVHEETGFQVRAARLVAVKDRHLHDYRPRRLERIYKLFFLCEIVGGAARTSIETSDVQFFSTNDLPDLSNGRVLVDDIVLLDRYRRDPSLDAYFD